MSLCVLLCVFVHTCASHFKCSVKCVCVCMRGVEGWIESAYQGVYTCYTCLGVLECLGGLMTFP